MGIFDGLTNWFRKSASHAMTSRELYDLIVGGSSTASGANVSPETAMRLGTVYACVNVISEDVAQLPLLVMKRTPGADGRDRRVRAHDHPLYELLHSRPNEWQTSFEFRSMLVAHLLLRGNAYVWINRVGQGDARRIAELIPLHPDAVRAKQHDDYSIEYSVTLRNGSVKRFPQGDVMHIRGLTLDGFNGVSPITYARETVGLAISAEKFGSRFFGNGARPSGLLEMPAEVSMTPEKKAELREMFTTLYGGENAHRVAILEGGLTFKPLTVTNEDSQFLELRKFQRTEVCAFYRLSPHKAGDFEHATYSNIEEQNRDHLTSTLLPWIVRLEQAFDRDLLTPRERASFYTKHVVDGMLRGDYETRTTGYARLVNIGVLSPNDVRELEDMDPRDGGDIYLTPVNMTTDPTAAGKPKKEPK